MVDRKLAYDFLAVTGATLPVLVGALYALESGDYDSTTLLVSVVLPLTLGSAILFIRNNRILLFGFLAYIWATIDDAPVFFDSVLTWPEVTQFHPFIPRLIMNLVIHALTAFFLYLTIREAVRGARVDLKTAARLVFLTITAFTLAYAQNIPLSAIQNAVLSYWFPFDFVEKLSSILVLCLAIREARMISSRESSV